MGSRWTGRPYRLLLLLLYRLPGWLAYRLALTAGPSRPQLLPNNHPREQARFACKGVCGVDVRSKMCPWSISLARNPRQTVALYSLGSIEHKVKVHTLHLAGGVGRRPTPSP